MHWIPASSRRRTQPGKYAVCLMILLAVLLSGASRAEARQWPHGWSNPRTVGMTVWHHGHRSAADAGGMWFALTEHEDGALALRVKRFPLEGTGKSASVDIAIPVAHSLRNYALAVHRGSAWLAWIERQEGTMSTLWLAEIGSDAAMTRYPVWQSPAFADGPEIHIESDGTVFLAFTSAETGLARVKLLVWDSEKKQLLRELSLTDGTILAQRPAVVTDAGDIHLVFFREDHVETYAMYQRHGADGALLKTINLGLVPDNHKLTPSLLPDGRGSLFLVWQSHTGIGDRVTAGAPTYGVLRSGEWEQEPRAITTTHRGRIATVRGHLGEDGVLLVSWVAESAGMWQAYAVELDRSGHQLSSGFATIAPSNVVEPRPFRIDSKNLISFSQIQPSGEAVVAYVVTDTTRRESLAFRLGLDVNRPLLDAGYKFSTVLFAAAGYSFGATGAVATGLMVVYLLSFLGLVSARRRGKWLRVLLLFAVLMMLKIPGTPLYFGALLLPGWSAVVSWLGSALFSLAILVLSGMDIDDFFVLGAAGMLFVFCDSYVSLYFYGAGRW